MIESERLERWKDNYEWEEGTIYASTQDEEIRIRIAALLNNPKVDEYCLVDAYYYDFSVIPNAVNEKLQLWRDAYMIYGITTDGEMITKWVDRWDLDSDDPIIDGKVIHSEKKLTNITVPEINQLFERSLLCNPHPDMIFSNHPVKDINDK